MTPEQLSRLIDADLEAELIDSALTELGMNELARESVTVYQLVGDALLTALQLRTQFEIQCGGGGDGRDSC